MGKQSAAFSEGARKSEHGRPRHQIDIFHNIWQVDKSSLYLHQCVCVFKQISVNSTELVEKTLLTYCMRDTFLRVPIGKQFGSQSRPHNVGPALRAKLFATKTLFLK